MLSHQEAAAAEMISRRRAPENGIPCSICQHVDEMHAKPCHCGPTAVVGALTTHMLNANVNPVDRE